MSLAEFESWMAYLDRATEAKEWSPGAQHDPHHGVTDANVLWADYVADPSGFEALTAEQKAFLAEEAKWRLGRLGDVARRAVGALEWDPLEHPRDANGRFVEVGDTVTLPGGRIGTVTAVLPGGNLTVMDSSRSRVVEESVPAADVAKPVRRDVTPDLMDRLVAADRAVPDRMPPKAAADTVARWRKVKAKRGVPVGDGLDVPQTGFTPGDVLRWGHPGRWRTVTVLDTDPATGTMVIRVPYTAGGTTWTTTVPNRLGAWGGNVLTWPRNAAGERLVPKRLAEHAIDPADLASLSGTATDLTPEEARAFAQRALDRVADLSSRPDLDEQDATTLAVLAAAIKDKRFADWLGEDSLVAAYRVVSRRDAPRRRRWAAGDTAVLPDGRRVVVLGPGSRPGRTRVRSGSAPFQVDTSTLGFPKVPGSGPDAGRLQVPDHMLAAFSIGDVTTDSGLTSNEVAAAVITANALDLLSRGDLLGVTRDLPGVIAEHHRPQPGFSDGRDHAQDLYDAVSEMATTWLATWRETRTKPSNNVLATVDGVAATLLRMVDGVKAGDDPLDDTLMENTLKAARKQRLMDPYGNAVWKVAEAVAQLRNEWAPSRPRNPNPYKSTLPGPDPNQGVLFDVDAVQPEWLPDRWTAVTDPDWATHIAADMYDDAVLANLSPADRKALIDNYVADLTGRRQTFTLDGGKATVTFVDTGADLPHDRKAALMGSVTKAIDATGETVAVVVDPTQFENQQKGALAFTIRGTPLMHIRPDVVEFAADRDEDGQRTAASLRQTGGSMNNQWNLNVDVLDWVVAHELGHVIDKAGPSAYADRIGFTAILDMSPYGNTHPAEAYAEAFATWLVTGGDFNSQTVDALARFGRWRTKYRKVKGHPWAERRPLDDDYRDRLSQANGESGAWDDSLATPVAAARPTRDRVPVSGGTAQAVAEYASQAAAARDALRRQAESETGTHYGVVGVNGRYYVVVED